MFGTDGKVKSNSDELQYTDTLVLTDQQKVTFIRLWVDTECRLQDQVRVMFDKDGERERESERVRERESMETTLSARIKDSYGDDKEITFSVMFFSVLKNTTKIYIHQLREATGYRVESLVSAMIDRDGCLKKKCQRNPYRCHASILMRMLRLISFLK